MVGRHCFVQTSQKRLNQIKSNSLNLISSQGWISHVLRAKRRPRKTTSVPGLLCRSFNHSVCLPPVINMSYFTTNCLFGSSDGKDLLGTVAELKHAHRKLSEQNSGLLRTVAQCEDVNLQLTLEITDLRAKLAR